MATHKLFYEPELNDLDVVCVHTALPSYLFVFQLNRILGLSLFRSKEDIAPTFAIYEYHCDVMQHTWRVIENHFTAPQKETENSLFDQSTRRFYLFPELEKTDLLVSVNGVSEKVIKKIQSINRVISCNRLPKKLHNLKEQLTF